MDTDELHEQICKLLDLLPDETKYHIRWNFITDIETNDIRSGCLELAQELYEDLHYFLYPHLS